MLREENNKFLKQLKGKSSDTSKLDPKDQAMIYTPRYYTPTKLYKSYPESHKDRQQFRTDKEGLLKAQLKETQKHIRNLAGEIT